MKIISKFQDYYDSALMYGIDENLIYVRKEESMVAKVPGAFGEAFQWIPSFYPTHDIAPSRSAILFCGKVYPLCTLTYQPNCLRSDVEHAYDAKTYINFVAARSKKDTSLWERVAQPRRWYRRRHASDSDWKEKAEERITKGYQQFANIAPDISHLHHEYKSPVIMLREPQTASYHRYRGTKPDNESMFELVLNPCLKDIRFARMVDPFTAFQEVSMFLGGVIGSIEDNTVQIDDVHMRDAKGFDDRSFKTASPGKKRKMKRK